jgi:hypothetical protein
MISNEIRESLQKVCAALNKNKVDYLVVGGVAVGFYGYQRISGISLIRPEVKTDLDFWYNPTTDNYINLVNALNDLGVDTTKLKTLVFDPQKTFLKIPHKNFHTDFLPQMMGLRYMESKKNSSQHILDGNEISILSYSDLLLNKKVVSREIDKRDIEGLTEM